MSISFYKKEEKYALYKNRADNSALKKIVLYIIND